MKTQLKIEETETTIRIHSEYNDNWVSQARSLQGKWVNSAWQFPIEAKENIYASIEKYFGSGPVVKVRADLYDFSDNGIIGIGGYSLAQRRGRDRAAELFPGVTLIKGELASYGGSAKHPRVSTAKDTIVTFYVHKTFAEAKNLEILEEATKESVNDLEKYSTEKLINELYRRGFDLSYIIAEINSLKV